MYGAAELCKLLQVLRRSINLEKFRTRATKEDAIELKSPVTTEDLVAEVWLCSSWFLALSL